VTQAIASVESETGLAVPEKSIAVLPFENLSADPENAFFADGVQDEILTNLAKIADLKVTSRSSVMQYRAPIRDLREIGGALGVAHILEGSVQRAGNRVRVSAQLIDARTDTHLWAENYHRPLDDVFAIQSEIAKAVADQLQAKLSPAEKSAIEQPPTIDLVAYDRYLRGKKSLTQYTLDARMIEQARQGIRLLDQAVAHDPAFYVAYCQLARAHELLYFLGADHSPARVAQARQAVEKALSLAAERGEAHLAAAYVSYHCELDYTTALSELAIASRGLPNDPEIFHLAGVIARRQSRWEDSIRDMESRSGARSAQRLAAPAAFLSLTTSCVATPIWLARWIELWSHRLATQLRVSHEHWLTSSRAQKRNLHARRFIVLWPAILVPSMPLLNSGSILRSAAVTPAKRRAPWLRWRRKAPFPLMYVCPKIFAKALRRVREATGLLPNWHFLPRARRWHHSLMNDPITLKRSACWE
jgi:TolB-like protein